jgi:N-acyl-D-aspartate/D-glutamate deacylase
MALLSPFRNSSESFFPESLKQRLKTFGLLDDIGDVALRRLLAESDWFGLPGGTLTRGADADLVLFDPDEEWTVRAEDLHSRSKNSAFIGHRVFGSVKHTLVGGINVTATRIGV